MKLLSLVVLETLVEPVSALAMQNKNAQIVVIGAGISGIAAARTLKDQGYEVVILEARNRIGGRMWTDESLGTPLDMRASWIHKPKGNPIAKLAKEFNIDYTQTDWESLHVYSSRGEESDRENLGELLVKVEKIQRKALKYANKQDKDISMMEAVKAVLDIESLSKIEKEELYWQLSTLEMDGAIEFEQQSSWGDYEDGFRGDDVLFVGGYRQILDKLVVGLDIRFEQVVKKIEHNSDFVEIETVQDYFKADYAILTVPLGVLKQESIVFEPVLPTSKTKAIEELGMGNLNKLAIRFLEVFWPADSYFLGYIGEERGAFPIFANWATFTDKPYLLGVIGNSFARKIAEWPEEKLKSELNKIFQKIFKNAKPIEAIQFSAWMNDPYAGGSYSFLPVGVTGDVYDELAKPIGRLLFAGEATMRGFSATVHGAYMSGIREAERVLEIIIRK
ncbi:MAG: FAD-dependent oxidoreductase [Aureispira sp.]|nr:FAD-dependent oxidoreductase [Aureispira sp.]